MKTKKRRGLIIGLVLLVLAAGGAYLYFAKSAKAGAQASAEGGVAERVKVEKRSVSDDIEVSGHLKPRAEQDVRAPADGIVEEVFVHEGQGVKENEALAALDSTAARYEVDKLNYDIDQQRFAGNKRKVDLLLGELAVRQRAVEDLTIRAHLEGRVSRLNLKKGDVLKAGEAYGRVIDVRSLVADVEISELDIPRAKAGLEVEFHFPALPGLTAAGRLASFASEARVNDQRLTVLDAKLVIDEPPPGLLPAYSFNAVIKTGSPRDVLVVDARAINYRAGKPQVERLKADGSTESLVVETEGYGAGLVRVLTGLSEGDELLIPLAGGGKGR